MDLRQTKFEQNAPMCTALPAAAKKCQKKYLRAIYWVLLCTLWAYFTAFVSIMWKIAALSKENKLSQLTLIYQDKLFKLHHRAHHIQHYHHNNYRNSELFRKIQKTKRNIPFFVLSFSKSSGKIQIFSAKADFLGLVLLRRWKKKLRHSLPM